MISANQSRLLLGGAAGYAALLAAAIGVQAFALPVFATLMEGERMAQGCFRTRTMLFGVDCHGFVGAGLLQILLDIPLMLVMGPFAGIFELASFTEAGEWKHLLAGAGMLVVASALWAPLIYLFIQLRRASEQWVAEKPSPPSR